MSEDLRSVDSVASSHACGTRQRGARQHCPPLRVLVVDSDRDAVHDIERVLAPTEFDVAAVFDGTSGLARACLWSFDLIVVDLALSDMSGLALLRILRARGVGAPVVVTGTGSDTTSALDAGRLGAFAYCPKPCDDQIVGCLRAATSAVSDARDAAAGAGYDPFARVMRDVARTARRASSQRYDRPPQLMHDLVECFLLPDRSVPQLLACAHCWKRLVACERPSPREAGDVQRRVAEILCPARTYGELVDSAVVLLVAAEREVLNLQESQLGLQLGVDPGHLGRQIYARTGLRFREWRWGLSLRVVMVDVISGEGLVKQIAYAAGFEGTRQFDRVFREIFGMPPLQMRREAQLAYMGRRKGW